MVLILLSFLCNHDFTKTASEKKIAILCLFVGRFKVRSVPGIINKDVLAQFIYKLTYWTEKLFTYRNFEIYSSTCIEEKGWVKDRIPLDNR